jgi:hypothetical protein
MTGTMGDVAVPPVARVGQRADLPATFRALNVKVHRPVLVLVGGANGMTPDHLAAMAKAIAHVIPALESWQAAVIDGGTDSGVMKVMGQARTAAGARFPLIGVAAEGTVILPGRPAAADAAPLEPRHTQVLLVPGDAWGDESPWLSWAAAAIADGQPSLTLVANGGQITYDDIDHSLQAGRPVIILAGTGRTADAIAAAARGDTRDARAARISACPGTHIVPLNDPPVLYSVIDSILGRPGNPIPPNLVICFESASPLTAPRDEPLPPLGRSRVPRTTRPRTGRTGLGLPCDRHAKRLARYAREAPAGPPHRSCPPAGQYPEPRSAPADPR